jgi:alpha-galactosidase
MKTFLSKLKMKIIRRQQPWIAGTVFGLVCLAALTLAGSATGQENARPDDMARASGWLRQNLLTSEAVAPFSFVFDGKPSAALLPGWKKEIEQRKLDDHRTAHRLTWTDAASGLVLRCDAVQYDDFPTVEWTLHLKNTGPKATAVIENIQALDVQLARTSQGEFVLHHQTGDNFSAHSYEPHEVRLDPKGVQRYAPDGGRPTNGAYPYYNLVYDGGGLIVAVGWPGQWAARFERDAGSGLRIAAGQQLTHFVLRPGEEVRTPLVVLQFYSGDRIDSQNVWRRWMTAHNLPRANGKLPEPFCSTCVGVHQSEAGEIGFIKTYLKNGIKFDYWWMDAGWYTCQDWGETGTWVPDPKRFPHGIRGVSDYAHSKGMKLILWFEPERVRGGTWLSTKHPEWLLGTGGDRLLNLGNPAAHKWLTEYIDHFLIEQGIDLYRQDFNIDPLGFWRSNDAPDRQGITEIRYVEGYLSYWDELRRRHPGMFIDSCASGGRRNDLETLRRAVPLLRSDYQQPQVPGAADIVVGNQGHTYGLSFWVPYSGTGIFYDNVYAVRSHLTPMFGIGCTDPLGKIDWAAFRRRIDDWKQVGGCFYGDYYPLTPYSLSESAWIAWQFHQPEKGEGMVQAFRRLKCPEGEMRLKLRGLKPDAVYEVHDLDRDDHPKIDGRTLMESGLVVRLPHPQGAALFHYKIAGGPAQ